MALNKSGRLCPSLPHSRSPSSSSFFRCSSSICSTCSGKAFSPCSPPVLPVRRLTRTPPPLCLPRGKGHTDCLLTKCWVILGCENDTGALSAGGDSRESTNHHSATNGHPALLKRKERCFPVHTEPFYTSCSTVAPVLSNAYTCRDASLTPVVCCDSFQQLAG